MNHDLKELILNKLQSQYKSSFCSHRQQFLIYEFSKSEVTSDFLNHWKEFAKRKFGRIYPQLIKLFSPVYGRDKVIDFLHSSTSSDFIVNMGSGTSTYPNVVNLDGCAYMNVHVVANLEQLPFEDAVVDKIISIAVLEHVKFPEKHVAEFLRVLKPGGQLVAFVPFLQPFHASPSDFQRFTDVGLAKLFESFSCCLVSVASGPTSSLVWIFQEWLAMVLSFGSMRLYRILVPVMWLLSPLKFLDIVLAHHPAARIAASGFYVTATKPSESN